MRDDQVALLVRHEIIHQEGISLLRQQQIKIRIDCVTETLANPFILLLNLFYKGFVVRRVDALYAKRASEYNARLREQLTKKVI